jgi:hypothetical protein
MAWLAGSRLPERRARLAWLLIGLGYLSVACGDALDGWRVWRGLSTLALTDAFWLGYFPVRAGPGCCACHACSAARSTARASRWTPGIVTTCGAC